MNFVSAHFARYRALGFSPIPVKTLPYGQKYEIPPGPDKEAKRPLVRWEEFQQRFPTADELSSWARHWPNAGIAIVTGAISDVVVVDDDRIKLPPLHNRTVEQEAAFESLKRKFGGNLEQWYQAADDFHARLMEVPTARAKSGGGGYHFWFRMPRNVDGVMTALGSATKFLPGWDIRADGGYIIVPPSIHPSGAAYVWDGEEHTPEAGIVPMPHWVLETITRLPAATRYEPVAGQPAWEIGHDIFEGLRNDSIASWFGGHMRGAIFYNEESWPTLLNIAKTYNLAYLKPPLDDAEIADAWTSIAKKERNRRGRVGAITDPTPVGFTAAELETKRLEPPGYAVNGLFVDGTTILFGKPKSGKSFLCMQTAIAVATGQPLFPTTAAMYAFANHPQGFGTTQGDVLYLALEDGEVRLQDRFRDLYGRQAWPKNIEFYMSWPACHDGGLVRIERWLDTHPKARLIIIDIAAMFMSGDTKGRGSLFRAEYHLFRPLVDVSKDRKIPVLIVDHASKGKGKMGSSDVYDSGAGTLGSQAAIDSTMVLEHADRGPYARLNYKGRDIERGFIDLEHTAKSPLWKIRTTFDEVKAAKEGKRVNGSH